MDLNKLTDEELREEMDRRREAEAEVQAVHRLRCNTKVVELLDVKDSRETREIFSRAVADGTLDIQLSLSDPESPYNDQATFLEDLLSEELDLSSLRLKLTLHVSDREKGSSLFNK